MQNRFNFRAYGLDAKRMIHYFDIGGQDFYYGLFIDNMYFGRGVWHVMQCTGLKDKNGKLIYEGDIIVIPNQYPFYDYKNKEEYQDLNKTDGEIKGETILNYVGVVEFIFNGWQYVLNCVNPLKRGVSNGINHHLNEQGFEEDENSCYEIIGNIYENPELLEVNE